MKASDPNRERREEVRRRHVPDSGGDPACWLDRVCPECGLFAEDTAGTVCSGCGTEMVTR